MFGIKKYTPPTIVIPDQLPTSQRVQLEVSTHNALKMGYANEIARMSVVNQRLLAMQAAAERTRTKKKIFGDTSRRGEHTSEQSNSSSSSGAKWEVCPPDMFEPG